MWNIFIKELKFFFNNPTGYVVIGLFLIGTAMFLWVLPGTYNVLDSGYANLDSLFAIIPWLYFFLCPAITMRLFAEERTSGTMEILLTKPVSGWSIVLGKALAGWVLVFFALLPTLLWYITLLFLSENISDIDNSAFWTSWIGLVLLAGTCSLVGVFTSSISKSQMVAFFVAAALSFCLYYGFDLAGSMFSGKTEYVLSRFGLKYHYYSMSHGVIDSRDIIYFAAIDILFLWLTKFNLKTKMTSK